MISTSAQRIILTIVFLLNGFFGVAGVIYGWVSLSDLLVKDGEYSSLCPPTPQHNTTLLTDDVKCDARDAKLATIYTVAANIASFATVVYGFTLDRYGVRLNALSGNLICGLGYILLGLSSSTSFDAFLPAYTLIAFGGIGSFLPSFQFGNLYARSHLVRTVISGLYTASGLLFTILIGIMNGLHISRHTLFISYGIFVFLLGLAVFLTYPNNPYQPGDECHLPIITWLSKQDTDDLRSGLLDNHVVIDSERMSDESRLNIASVDVDGTHVVTKGTINGKDSDHSDLYTDDDANAAVLTAQSDVISQRTLKQEIIDPCTIWMSMFFAIGLLWTNEYMTHINSLLKSMGDDSDDAMKHTFILIVSLVPIAMAPLVDIMQAKIKYAGNCAVCVTLLILIFSTLFVNNRFLQIFSFICLAGVRAVLFPFMFSFVATQYRHDHYGKIVGFITIIATALGFLQFAMDHINDHSFNGNFNYLMGFMMIGTVPFYAFAYVLWRQRK